MKSGVAMVLAACALVSAAGLAQAKETQPGELFPDVPGAGPARVVRFGRSTPAQNAAALATARKTFAKFATKWHLKTTELATAHALILTDAPASEQEFLRTAVEKAHAAVTALMQHPPTEPLYLAKVPVFVLAQRDAYAKGAEEFDAVVLDASVPGYFAPGEGGGHVTMRLPAADDEAGRTGFAHVLTREYMQAFLARWVSDQPLPLWLSRGLGEAAAGDHEGIKEAAAKWAAEPHSLQELLQAETLEGESQPVVQTLVEMLAERDPKALVALCRAIKEGQGPEAALKASFGLTYRSLEGAWRAYVKKPDA